MGESCVYKSGGNTYPIKPVSWEDGNGLVTSGVRANLYPTSMSRQAPQRVG